MVVGLHHKRIQKFFLLARAAAGAKRLRWLPFVLALVWVLVNSLVTKHMMARPEFDTASASAEREDKVTRGVLRIDSERIEMRKSLAKAKVANRLLLTVASAALSTTAAGEVPASPDEQEEFIGEADFTECTSPERSVPWPLSGEVTSRTSDMTCGIDDATSQLALYLREQTLPLLVEHKDECQGLVVYGVAFGSQHTQLISAIHARYLKSDKLLERHGQCFFMFVLEEDMPTTTMVGHTWLIPIPRNVLPYKNLRRNTKLFKYHGHFLFPYAHRIIWQDAKFFKRVYVRAQPTDYMHFNTGACVTAMTLPVHPNTFGASNLADARSLVGKSEQWTYQPQYIHHCEAILDALEKRPDVTDSAETLMQQCYAYAMYMKEQAERIGTSAVSLSANSTLTLDQGLLDSAFLVWNYATDECRNFNAELQCTLSDQLQCHSDRDQVSFPFAMAQMGLRVKEGTEHGALDQRRHHLELTNNGDADGEQTNNIMVHMTKSACHWYFRSLDDCGSADRPSIAIVVAGSTKRLQFESTLRHLIRPLADANEYNVDYYAVLTEKEAPAFRQESEYMSHIIADKLFQPKGSQVFLNGKAVARNLVEKVEDAGGHLRGIDLRRQSVPLNSPELSKKRQTARRRYRKQDVDLRFPMLDLRLKHRKKIANGNRNIINLFNGLQHLWDNTLVPFENSIGKQYEYVMILRDDAMWLDDFKMPALLAVTPTVKGPVDAYVLSCDARVPAMAAHETNDHAIVIKREKASVVGRYFSSLLAADLQACHKAAGYSVATQRGCNSEMILTWILRENNVTVQGVPQSLLPFERSVTVRKPGGSEEHCFHKFCQSFDAPLLIPEDMRMCTAVDFSNPLSLASVPSLSEQQADTIKAKALAVKAKAKRLRAKNLEGQKL